MYKDRYICEAKGIPLVSYYKELKEVSVPQIFTTLHYHSDFEILYITAGKAKMIIKGNVYFAEKGSLILINPYEVHYGEILSPEFSYYCMDFNVSLLSLVHEEKILKEEIKYENHVQNSAFEKYIRSIYNSYEKEPQGWKLRARGELLVMFSYLEDKLISTLPSKETEFSKKVINYVTENYMKNITSKDIAEVFSYNQSYFCRMFKKQFFMKFSEYLNLLRVKKAKELLKTEDVSHTAMLCGFSGISYFSTAFKEQCGMSPMQYKKQLNQRDK